MRNNHNHYHVCSHILNYCSICDIVYCSLCGKEWENYLSFSYIVNNDGTDNTKAMNNCTH